MCKLYRILYKLIPIKAFQSYLIKNHFSVCPQCGEAAGIDDLGIEKLLCPENFRDSQSLWPHIEPKLQPVKTDQMSLEDRSSTFFRKWRWALAGICLAVVIGASALFYRNIQKKAYSDAGDRFPEEARIEIANAEVYGKKARSFIYQTSSASFIWFSENQDNGGQNEENI